MTYPITADLSAAVEDADLSRIVVVEQHPSFPSALLFQTFDPPPFLVRYGEWLSRYSCLNELYLLHDFVALLEKDGWTVLFGSTAAPVLESIGRWEQPLAIDGFTCPGGSSLYPYQTFTLNRALERAQADNPTDRLTYVGWATGTGKAQPVSEPVLTPTGWSTMGELKPGDEVVGSDGKPTRVLAVYPQGNQPTWRVTFNDKTFARCNDDHLWNVRRNEFRSKNRGSGWPVRENTHIPWKTLTTKEIRSSMSGRRWQLPQVSPVQFSAPEKDLPLDPYILGAFLGDGNLSPGVLTATITTADRWLVDHLGWKERDKDNHFLLTAPREVTQELRAQGLAGCRSWEKFIPAQFLTASMDQRLALLQGLMDTDGFCSRNGTNADFSTTSPSLRDGVADLVRGLGGRATVSAPRRTKYTNIDGDRVEGRDSWRVTISILADIFRLPRKAERWSSRLGKYQPKKTIVSITEDGYDEQVCILVDSPDNLYVTRDYALTHNSLFAAAGAQEMFNRGLVDICIAFTLGPLKVNLARFFQKTTSLDVAIPDGVPAKRQKIYDTPHDVYVLNYEKARVDYDALSDLTAGKRVLFVADEALALDTPMLTSEGWSTIGEILPGDQILGTSGWTTVLRKTEVKESSPCMRVTFDDHSSLVVSSDHRWSICGRDGVVTETLTTAQMDQRFSLRGETPLAKGLRAKGTRWINTLRVPVAEAADFPPSDLPIDPWILGYWLGNGERQKPMIIVGEHDAEAISSEITRRGHTLSGSGKLIRGSRRWYLSSPDKKLRSALAGQNLLNNKHIPESYLWASRQQRMELLRGLMDSDGYAAKGTGVVVFTQRPGPLMDGVERLVRSLGFRVVRRVLSSSGFATETKTHQLSWRTTRDQSVFTNPRKGDRLPAVSKYPQTKRVVAIDLVDSVPVQCLEVDAEDHLFCAGEGLTVTHNCHKLLTESKPNTFRKRFDELVTECTATVWPMSASVVASSPLRYRDVFNLSGHPRQNPLGTKGDFVKRYAAEVRTFNMPTKYGSSFPVTFYEWHMANLHEVRHRVADRAQSVRKTDPAIRDLFKGLQTVVIPVQLSKEDQRLYDAVVDMARPVKQGGGNLMPFYRLLRYICNNPDALKWTTDPTGKKLAKAYPKLVTAAHSAKLEAVIDLVESIRDSGDKTLIFTQWVSMSLNLIAAALDKAKIRYVIHHGGQSSKDNQKAQEEFKADPEITVFLSSDAGAHGLNMTEARYVIHYESPYSYDTMMQRSNRIDRADSHLDGLTAYVFVTDDSVEERVWGICNDRRELASVTLGTTEALSYSGKSEEQDLEFLIFGKE